MTNALPAYLQTRQSRAVAERATAGIGASLPPHISIRGNEFTLIDAAGNEDAVETKYLDACVADISDVMCKQYYGKEWAQDSNDPPLCWSANGVAPSINATQAQSRTCAECKWNVRGSATSKLSGAAIKACRDEKWLCVIPVGIANMPEMLFQLKLTPGSFKNWQALNERFKGQTVDLSDVVVRMTFERGSNGVLEFTPTGYIDEAVFGLREKALTSKATDVLVGRNDVPRTAALPAPVSLANAQINNSGQLVSAGQFIADTLADPLAKEAGQRFTPEPAPSFPMGQQNPLPVSTGAAPADPPTRKRRTKAEMEAAKGQPDPNAAAPFRPQAPPPNGPAFGMAQPSPISQELNKTLDGLFGPAPGK